MPKHTVAVYGSLRKKLNNHCLLQQASYLGLDKIPNFTMYSKGPFPYLKPTTTSNLTTIEVYDVTDDEFARLDQLEGYPRFYDRTQISTKYGQAWIYFIDKPNPIEPEVKSGDWKQYLEQRDDY